VAKNLSITKLTIFIVASVALFVRRKTIDYKNTFLINLKL